MKKEFGYVTDREGNAVAGAEVYVRKQSDNSLLQLYSDNGSTTTANPLVTDNDGEYSFYTADNVIKVQTFVDGVQQQEINNVQHFDLSAISAFAWTFLDDADAATVLTTIGAQPLDTDLSAIAALTSAADKGLQATGAGTWALYDLTAAGKALLDDADAAAQRTTLGINSTNVKLTESIIIACSDETTALSAGTAKVTLRMPYAFTVTAVYASLTTAQTSGNIFTVDINEGGTSILSTKLTIDNTEDDSDTATTPAVISDSSLAHRAKITIDIDQIGDGTAKGLKVTLVGTRT